MPHYLQVSEESAILSNLAASAAAEGTVPSVERCDCTYCSQVLAWFYGVIVDCFNVIRSWSAVFSKVYTEFLEDFWVLKGWFINKSHSLFHLYVNHNDNVFAMAGEAAGISAAGSCSSRRQPVPVSRLSPAVRSHTGCQPAPTPACSGAPSCSPAPVPPHPWLQCA